MKWLSTYDKKRKIKQWLFLCWQNRCFIFQGLQFEPSHQQNFIQKFITVDYLKDKNIEKEARNG